MFRNGLLITTSLTKIFSKQFINSIFGKYLSKPVPVDNVMQHVYRPDIDGLRSISVLSVVIFHAVPVLLNGGFVGVDIFFVISGYLISAIILKGFDNDSFSFLNFYTRRIKRIFPALILVLVSSYILGWFLLLADEYKMLGKHIAGGASFISNFILWKESGYFDTDSTLKPLLHLWSLGIEEQFYLIWPLVMYLLWRLKANMVTIFFVFSASFICNIIKIHLNPEAVFYLPITRLWELLVGSILAYICLNKTWYLDKISLPIRNCASFIGLIFIAIACIRLNSIFAFPGWWALLPTIGTFLIIAAGSDAWINRKVLAHPILVLFGIISYPLYLWHWPVIFFMNIISPNTSTPQYRIIPIFISILLAVLTYKLIERPLRYGRYSTQKTIGLLASMTIVGLVGFSTYKYDGLGFRYDLPLFIQQVSSNKFDMSKIYREHSCLLASDEDSSKFSKTCVDSGKRPLIFIWGDSYAAALYPGFKLLQSKRQFGIAQYTASACPPLLTYQSPTSRPLCKSINDANLIRIKNIKPDIVILHARWRGQGYDLSKLNITVSELKKIGIKKIVLLGPVPEWADTLPRNIVSYWRKNHSNTSPLRMNFGLRKVMADVDVKLSHEAMKLGIDYISAYKVMCNNDGCLTRIGDSYLDLTAIDHGHLAPKGSYFLIDSIAPNLFNDISHLA